MVGAMAALTVAIVGVCGFWVTAAHIYDWKMRLRRLDRPAKVEPTPGRYRR
jgi:hypothetical protein